MCTKRKYSYREFLKNLEIIRKQQIEIKGRNK